MIHYTKVLRSIAKALEQKTVRLRSVFLSFKSPEGAGAWGCQIPNKFLPCIYRAELALHYATLTGASADLGRLASVKKGFLMENDAIALAEFLMRSVIVRFL